MTPVLFPVLALLTISGLEISYAQSLPPFEATFAFTSCITVEPKAGPINTTAGQVFDFNVVNGSINGHLVGTITGGTEELTEGSDGSVLSVAHVYGHTDPNGEPFSIDLTSRGNTTVMIGQASGILNGNSAAEHFTCKSGPKDGDAQGLVGVTDCYVLH